MKYLFILLPAVLLILSCRSSMVVVKFKNNSGEDFKKFDAQIFDNKFAFENLKAGEAKKVKVDKAYSYCKVVVVTQQDTLRRTPIDYLGETLYTSGKIKMNFTIAAVQNGKRRLVLKTNKDK